MKKIIITIFVSLFAIVLTTAIAFVLWMHYPSASMIEKKATRLGIEKLQSSFDAWLTSPSKKERYIRNEELPEIMQSLCPDHVALEDDGIYLSLKTRFVQEDGIFIARLGDKTKRGIGTDPSFYHIEGRVYRYHISG